MWYAAWCCEIEAQRPNGTVCQLLKRVLNAALLTQLTLQPLGLLSRALRSPTKHCVWAYVKDELG